MISNLNILILSLLLVNKNYAIRKAGRRGLEDGSLRGLYMEIRSFMGKLCGISGNR